MRMRSLALRCAVDLHLRRSSVPSVLGLGVSAFRRHTGHVCVLQEVQLRGRVFLLSSRLLHLAREAHRGVRHVQCSVQCCVTCGLRLGCM